MITVQPAQEPRVLSVNVRCVHEVIKRDRLVRTAIWKEPLGARATTLRAVNLDGDDQTDRAAHAGIGVAVYAYAEDSRCRVGENGNNTQLGPSAGKLALRGVELRGASAGERWRFKNALLEVAQPRRPCLTIGIRMGNQRFPRRFQSVGRPSAYVLAIERDEVCANRAVHLEDGPDYGLTLRHMAHALGNRRRPALLVAPQPPHLWRRLASGEDER